MKDWFQGLGVDYEQRERDILRRIVVCVIVALVLVSAVLIGTAQAQTPAKPDIIEVIELYGEIGQHTARQVKEAVEKINENQKIKAVVLVVDSPGGGASASAVVYQELAKIKVPVVGFCEYLCASGGVYALMAPSVKYIGVRDDTIGGSVGVIMQATYFHRLLNWAKIDNQVFKSGQFKDSGTPIRAATPEDDKYLQGIVDTLAVKFYGVVKKARPKITDDQWAEIKAAKIFIGQAVVDAGLADKVMSRDDAVAKAKEIAGTKNAYTRDELSKIVKNASEAASMRPTIPPLSDGWLDHATTLMGLLAEVRQGEAVKFSYRMPYTF